MDTLPASPLSQALVTCLSPSLLVYGRNPAVQLKIMDRGVLASWKLDSEEYIQVIHNSQHWSLDKEMNMNEEAIVNRGCAMANVFGIDMAKSSEHLLFLRANGGSST
jgi:hypothetical protein